MREHGNFYGWREYGYDEQCEAFAELIYYIHVLADIEYSNMNEGYSSMMKLAMKNSEEDSPDIYDEIEKILPKLFPTQTENGAYSELNKYIKKQAKEARDFIEDNPDLKPCYSQYKKYAENLLKELSQTIPTLLKQEEFFKNVFYSA